jgi:hypothetical protein
MVAVETGLGERKEPTRSDSKSGIIGRQRCEEIEGSPRISMDWTKRPRRRSAMRPAREVASRPKAGTSESGESRHRPNCDNVC